ncbi:MAG: hypothetical protein ACOVT5_16240 [Armatimonadaceae bacterium]|jgi:uncharacterized protein (TIGR03067 family)
MRTLLALLSLAAPLAAAPVPKALKKTPASLDGNWRWESQEKNGKVSQASPSDYCLWKVAGDTMTLVTEKGTMKDEPCGFASATNADGVRTFEYRVNSNGYHRRGVCELDGDTLRVAYTADNNVPPKAVKGEDGVTVYTFRRVTDSK